MLTLLLFFVWDGASLGSHVHKVSIRPCPGPPRGPGQHCTQFKNVGLQDLFWTGTEKWLKNKRTFFSFFFRSIKGSLHNSVQHIHCSPPPPSLKSQIPFNLGKSSTAEQRWQSSNGGQRCKCFDLVHAQSEALCSDAISLKEAEKVKLFWRSELTPTAGEQHFPSVLRLLPCALLLLCS